MNLIAVVDDDESIRLALIPALQSIGFDVLVFDSAESFIESARLSDVGCVITDLRMPGMSGLELQAKLRRDGYHIPTIFMTAHGVPEVRSQATAAGAVAFFDKPFDPDVLLETVQKLMEERPQRP